MQHEVLTESSRALSAGNDVSNNFENWWSFDSTLWWMGEAVIASTETTSDGETRCGFWASPNPEAQREAI